MQIYVFILKQFPEKNSFYIVFIDHRSCSEEVLGSCMSSIGGSFCGLKCQEVSFDFRNS